MTAEEQWGELRLRRELSLADSAPPDEILTSVRSVVFRRNEVVVLVDSDGSRHVMPGGRREPGELEMETLVREVREETGWSITSARRLGCLRYTHLTPRPDGYRYPYPVFVQSLFIAEAGSFSRAAIRRDGWETHSRLMPISSARQLVRPDQRILLDAAAARRREID